MKDITKKQTEILLNRFEFPRGVYLTLGFNDYVKFDLDADKIKERMKKNHKHFFNELHRQVYKKSKKKIKRYVVIERGGKTGGFHTHIVCEIPYHLSKDKFENISKISWLKTKDGVSFHSTEKGVYHKDGLDVYNAKQQSQNNNNAEVDFMNSLM